MKTQLKMSVLLLIGLVLAINAYADQRRFALIIGMTSIDDQAYLNKHLKQYDQDAVSGVFKDVTTIKRIVGLGGFEITPLGGAGATRQAILNAIKTIGTQIKPGDQFLLYYSGHGDVVPDTNGDEESGFDQVLVAYDDYVIDDEINVLLRQYFTKTFNCMIIDACHSGSVYKMASFFLDFKKMTGTKAFSQEKKALRQQALVQQCNFNEVIDEPYQLIYFGATADSSLSMGNGSGGLLTVSLNSVFNTALATGQWNTYTYRKLACALYSKLNASHQLLQYHEIGTGVTTFANRKPFNPF